MAKAPVDDFPSDENVPARWPSPEPRTISSPVRMSCTTRCPGRGVKITRGSRGEKNMKLVDFSLNCRPPALTVAWYVVGFPYQAFHMNDSAHAGTPSG